MKEAYLRVLGAEHPDTPLRSMGDLASTYAKLCQWDEAEVLRAQVVSQGTRARTSSYIVEHAAPCNYVLDSRSAEGDG